MRQAVANWVAGALEAVAPELLGDVWGRREVTVMVDRLSLSRPSAHTNGVLAVEGEVVALLWADTPDAMDWVAIADRLVDGLTLDAEPAEGEVAFIGQAVPTEWRERLNEGAAITEIRLALAGDVVRGGPDYGDLTELYAGWDAQSAEDYSKVGDADG
ncbi:hypothetical protein CKO33_02210 [Ectothiorhodospira mobilis]|nr:hypothetical protein [Ectothiorhodospira mobilis]